MDMLPPQAPPAIVSSCHQACDDAMQRMAGTQRWLADQQAELPEPGDDDAVLDEYLADMAAFWSEPVPGTPAENPIPRREALNRRLIQAARDAALLQTGMGLLDAASLALVQAAVRPSPYALPPDIRLNDVVVDDVPIAGMLVLRDDQHDDRVLLFTVHAGWELFPSIETLLGDLQYRLHEEDEDDAPPSISLRNTGATTFTGMTEHLIGALEDSLLMAWSADALVDTQSSFPGFEALVDPHAMVTTWTDEADVSSGRSRRSPPLRPTSLARGMRDGLKQRPPIGGRVARLPLTPSGREAAVALPGQVQGGRPVLALPAADTLFPTRFIVRNVTAPAGPAPLDGVFVINGTQAIRQGEHFYRVRFDAGMGGWRLNATSALDARYTGPLIERRPDGIWHYRRAGLAGGSGRPVVQAKRRASAPASVAVDVDQLTPEQLRILQGELCERIGLSDGIELYDRVMRQALPGAQAAPLTARELAVWNQSLAFARHGQRPVPTPPRPRTELSPELREFSADDLRWIQRRLIRRFEFADGSRIFHEMAYRPVGADVGPTMTNEHARAWTEVLKEAGERHLQAAPLTPPTPPALRERASVSRRKSSDIEGFSHAETQKLRYHLKHRLGNERGSQVYREMAFEASRGTPTASSTEQALWDEIVAFVVDQRGKPRARKTISTDIADIRSSERQALRTMLKERLGDKEGETVYQSMVYTYPSSSTPPSLTAAQRTAWEQALSDIRATRVRAYTRDHALSPSLADMSTRELELLRIHLRERIHYYPGEALYHEMAHLPPGTAPSAAVTPDKLTAWQDAVASVRSRRYAPASKTIARDALDNSLWFVPESEWPEVVFHYAPQESLEKIGDTAIALGQSHLSAEGIRGIPLFTLAPDVPTDRVASLANGWLPSSTKDAHRSLGSLTGAWARIELRPALKAINGEAPAFEVFRRGNIDSGVYVLRPTARSATAGTARHPAWLFDHYSVHFPSP